MDANGQMERRGSRRHRFMREPARQVEDVTGPKGELAEAVD
jgi:hypothetical protein